MSDLDHGPPRQALPEPHPRTRRLQRRTSSRPRDRPESPIGTFRTRRDRALHDAVVEVVGFAIVFIGAFAALVWWMQARLKQQGYRPSQQPPSVRVAHAFDPVASAQFRGGSRVGRLNATWPNTSLSIDADWAHLSGIASVWVPRTDVQRVRRIKSALPGSGIRFDTADGSLDGVIFWTFEPSAVLREFARLGWPADPG